MTEGGAAPRRLPVVHAITDDAVLSRPSFIEQASSVMQALGTRGALHLRSRSLTSSRLHELGLALSGYVARSGCVLAINDRVDVAVALRCWGVQLTSHSMPARDVRRIAPVLRIGVSVHSADEAGSVRGLADWILAGHVFPTASHPEEAGRGLNFLSVVVRAAGGAAGTPVVAIGGVTPEKIAVVRSAGARGIAAISGIWSASDAGAAASDYLTAYDDAADDAHDPATGGQR